MPFFKKMFGSFFLKTKNKTKQNEKNKKHNLFPFQSRDESKVYEDGTESEHV